MLQVTLQKFRSLGVTLEKHMLINLKNLEEMDELLDTNNLSY